MAELMASRGLNKRLVRIGINDRGYEVAEEISVGTENRNEERRTKYSVCAGRSGESSMKARKARMSNVAAVHRTIFAAIAFTVVVFPCNAESYKRWDFNKTSEREGWSVPASKRGVVMGGSVWLTLAPSETDPAKMATTYYQAGGDWWPAEHRKEKPDVDLIVSPSGLQIPASDVTQVRLRVMNLSSVTDFFLRWRTREQGWGDAGDPAWDWGQPPQSRRCTLKSDVKEWQEITCFLDHRWQGTIDQIALLNAQRMVRGDLWIDWIEIAKGPPEPVRERPDIASAHVVPKVTIPGISQAGFADAFKVLDECLAVDVPIYGFNYPVISPGGYYTTGGWWLWDSSLNLAGAKWANQRFAENVMRGFHELQAENPDGRIDLMGQHGIRGQVGDMSALPWFFEVAYDVARRSSDVALRAEIYLSMQRFLEWWLSAAKRDAHTGLVTAMFEETFGDRSQAPHIKGPKPSDEPMTLAPIDLNVAVAVGAARTSELAAALGKPEESARYHKVFQDLSSAINTHLWDEAEGAYYNYDLREAHRRPGLIVSTFDPLRLGIAPEARRNRLLKRMLDPAQFNWGKLPLTSWAMTDPGYVEARGDYDGRAWFGNVWPLLNVYVITGLEDAGEANLAAELNWASIKAFHGNYREFYLPSSGEGQGAKRYGESASKYIEAIIDHLFGVDFDAIRKRLRITPRIPQALYGKHLALDNLILPTGADTRLSVSINQSSKKSATITLRITGQLPEGTLQVELPGSPKKILAPTSTTNVVFP